MTTKTFTPIFTENELDAVISALRFTADTHKASARGDYSAEVKRAMWAEAEQAESLIGYLRNLP